MKLTREGAVEIISYNRNIIYHIPDKYQYLKAYIGKGQARDCLLKIFKYIDSEKEPIDPIIYNHKYCYYLYTKKISTLRGYKDSVSRSNHIFNLLCALGLLEKITERNEIYVNLEFMIETGKTRGMNVFAIHRYNETRLNNIEERAERLYLAGIRMDNISNIMLRNHSCEDIAEELYPEHSETAPETSQKKFNVLYEVISDLVRLNGYTTKQAVEREIIQGNRMGKLLENNSIYTVQNELKKLYSYYMQDIKRGYNWKPPTAEQKERYKLNNKYIFTEKEK